MHTHPSLSELVEAVKHFIEETAAPGLSGHGKFHARIAANVLAIVLRELEQRSDAEAVEAQGLANLLGAVDAPLEALNQSLCQAIAAGNFTKDTPGLLAHLKSTAIAQLKIDQPHYSGLRAALELSE